MMKNLKKKLKNKFVYKLANSNILLQCKIFETNNGVTLICNY